MFKQVIIVRTDLQIDYRGKWGAQIAHASLSAGLKVLNDKRTKNWFTAWQLEGQKKVVLQVESIESLFNIRDKAKENRIPYYVVEDAGRTEIPAGTVTCIALGPALENQIDKITGDLPLFK